MIPAPYNSEERGSRVIDLADGRVLFLPRGRGGPAYVVADYPAGFAVSGKLEWAERLAFGGVAVTVLAASFLEQWLWLLVAVPLLCIPRLVEAVLVARLQPATDARARAEADGADPGAVTWGTVAVFLGMLAWGWFKWPSEDFSSGRARVELAIVAVAIVGSAVQLYRQHRTTQERRITGVSGDPQNTPINPR